MECDLFWCSKKGVDKYEKKVGKSRASPQRTGPSEEEKKIEENIVLLNLQEEIMWKQRSRIQWLNEGDNNTKFFHQKANRRRNKNRITQLSREDGTISEEIDEMQQMTRDFIEIYTLLKVLEIWSKFYLTCQRK